MSDFLTRTDANPPHWAGDIIGVWDEHKLRLHGGFLRRHYWTDQGSINVFCIKGTEHPDYQGLTWHDFLHRGKRMDRNIPMLERNPGYYLETERKKPSMYYNSYNGIDWYIGADGNHRSGLARFLFHEREMAYLHGVHLSHYEFDEPPLAVYVALRDELSQHTAQGFYMDLEVNHIHRGREDTAGWKTDTYSSSLYFSSGSWQREYRDNPAVSSVTAARAVSDPKDGWRLLHELRMWRDQRASAARTGFFHRLTGWKRP